MLGSNVREKSYGGDGQAVSISRGWYNAAALQVARERAIAPPKYRISIRSVVEDAMKKAGYNEVSDFELEQELAKLKQGNEKEIEA